MSSLELTKGYGLQERTQALLDLARNRLNSSTPHQASQRERVSFAAMPLSAQEQRAGRRRKQKNWKEMLRPDFIMGVPQLMSILEPNIVWDHPVAFNPVLGKEMEAQYCPGEFFEGWHREGRAAHGVYEGSYWEIIGDCDDMEAMLRKMSQAPPLLEEPVLNLPATADLPPWEEFKPFLQALPTAATLPLYKTPPFRAPILDSDLPFFEPEYQSLPELPDAAQEEPLPIFFPPEELKVDDVEELDYLSPEAPTISEAPLKQVFGKPEHGHDWTGTRPFTVPVPPYIRPQLLDVQPWVHPPGNLPKPIFMENLNLERAALDLDPLPRLELVWACGPDPEPVYASTTTTPRTLSRAPSPLRSVPSSRPVSAVPSKNTSYFATPPSTRPGSAIKNNTPQLLSAVPSVQPSTPMRYPSPPIQSQSREQSPPSARSSSPALVRPASARPASARPVSARTLSVEGEASRQEAWEAVRDVDAGLPKVWMNYEAPFAELPPIFMPPVPELGVCNGLEPLPADYPIGDLEHLPTFELPQEMALPTWTPPALKIPAWCPPCEPRPIGFMRGTAPVLILDVSGTMNPRQRGKFVEMKECACALLHPLGEIATSAGAFDVIAFCSAAWSWSATYSNRLSLLTSAQVFYSGRQNGGKVVAGSRLAEKTKAGAVMMPTEPDLLEDARNWVDKWPDAVGHTSVLSSFLTADEHWNADCWYLMSDGLADDPMQCMDFIDARLRHGQRVPCIHTVGFFPDDSPANFEGRRFLQQMSAMTGGTFQEYDPTIQRIYQNGVGFVNYNPRGEAPETRVEREWAEEQLRGERRKNIRLGIAERLDVTMARVQALHHQLRVQPLVKAHQASIAGDQAVHEAQLAEVTAFNTGIKERAQQEYQALVDEVTARNQEQIDSAQTAFRDAHHYWVETYELAVREWEQIKAQKEGERDDEASQRRGEALTAYIALQEERASRSPSPSSRRTSNLGSRPASAIRTAKSSSGVQGGSRPVSALRTTNSAAVPGTGEPRPISALRTVRSSASGAVPQPGSATSTARLTSGGGAPRLGSATPVRSRPGHTVGAADQNANMPAPEPPSNFEGTDSAAAVAAEAWDRELVGTSAGASDGAAVASGRSRPGSSHAGTRPALVRPQSASQRRGSGGYAGAGGVSGAAVASSLQQLLEEGDEDEEEDEEVQVEGEPSQLSIASPEPRSNLHLESDDGFNIDPEALEPPPPLELEDSQDLKRRIFPTAVVRELDHTNAARLAQIRAEWATLLADTEARNRKKLDSLNHTQEQEDEYVEGVYQAYADSFVKDVVIRASVRVATNSRAVKAAQVAYADEVGRIQAENDRLAACHTQEVEDKVFKEERYRQALIHWEAGKAAAWKQHATDTAACQQAHADNMSRLLKEQQAQKEEVDHLNEVRMSESQAHHTRMVEEVVVTNRRYRGEYADKVKACKAVEAENLGLLGAARQEHANKLQALATENETRLLQSQEDHQALCLRLEDEHIQAVEQAHKEFEELRAFLAAHNDGVLEEARKRFQEAIMQAWADHATSCKQLLEEHETELQRVRGHNEAIWPQVQMARIALLELGRVEAFAEHIKFCANKLQMGVNFMPNVPNYDRVVEMQALNESLIKAFPESKPQDYPWPGYEERGKPGTGWVASPATRVLDLKDPGIEINKMVARMEAAEHRQGSASRPASAKRRAPSRPGSARPGRITGETQETSSQIAWKNQSVVRPTTAPLTRPMSAGRPRFSSMAASSGPSNLGPVVLLQPGTPGLESSNRQLSSMGSCRMDPAELVMGGFSVRHTESRGSLSGGVVSRPSTASPRPGAVRNSILQQLSATAPTSLSGSPPPTARQLAGRSGEDSVQLRALSAGPGGSSVTTAAMAAAALKRGLVAASIAKAAIPARPASARAVVPARMSANLAGMQATMSTFRSSKSFGAPQAQQQAEMRMSGAPGALFRPGSAVGFRSDMPKLQYPDVDVRALV